MKWRATILPKMKHEDFMVMELFNDKEQSVGHLFLSPTELIDFEKKLLKGKAVKWQ